MATESELGKAQRLYDFVRFTYTDIHGIGRCKVVPKNNLGSAFIDGIGAYTGSIGFGLLGELNVFAAVYAKQPPDVAARANGNLVAVPEKGTLHPLPTSGAGKYKVGQVLCETKLAFSRETQKECPRYVARRELQRLECLGFQLYGSVELEFVLVKEGSLDPVFINAGEMFASLTFTKFEPILLEVAASLAEMGVEVETLQTEYGGGQFELVLKPQIGIKMADNTFLAKECVKEVARKHSLTAIFMTKFTKDYLCNGAHFNHSLRNISNGSNAFSDTSRKDLLSDTFRWWMGGLTRHFPSMNALCSPTINCYRRLGSPWAPHVSDWGVEDRFASFRVKNESPQVTYIESRLPSGSSNIYLVLAATVCAGLDGLTNRIPCPLPRENIISAVDKKDYVSAQTTDVPCSLEVALDTLEKDQVFSESLGSILIQWFVMLKREEIKNYKEDSLEKDKEFEWERNRYMSLL